MEPQTLKAIIALSDSILKTQKTQMTLFNLLSEALPSLSQEQKDFLADVARTELAQIKTQEVTLKELRRLA